VPGPKTALIAPRTAALPRSKNSDTPRPYYQTERILSKRKAKNDTYADKTLPSEAKEAIHTGWLLRSQLINAVYDLRCIRKALKPHPYPAKQKDKFHPIPVVRLVRCGEDGLWLGG